MYFLAKASVGSFLFIWKTNSLKLKLEEKYEEENLKIDFVDGVLLVNDVYYELSGINNWYKIYGNFFVAFDKNKKNKKE